MKLTANQIKELTECDPSAWTLIARIVNDSETAKQILRENGVGVTGMGILETVETLFET